MIVERTLILSGAAALLCGCHYMEERLSPDCHARQEYQGAQQVALLKVPEGLDSPNTQGSLGIPTVEQTLPPPGPKDACLDVPPKFKPAPVVKPGAPPEPPPPG